MAALELLRGVLPPHIDLFNDENPERDGALSHLRQRVIFNTI